MKSSLGREKQEVWMTALQEQPGGDALNPPGRPFLHNAPVYGGVYVHGGKNSFP